MELNRDKEVKTNSATMAGVMMPGRVVKVLTMFGTRPEAIKVAPVIAEMEARSNRFRTVNVSSGQHTELLRPFVELFGIRIDHDLGVMQPNQNPSGVCARVLSALDPILAMENPDLILVQGDTTTAMAGALAGFHRGIAVGHIEAGLRSGDIQSPFPEEMNRRLISRLASVHFAATEHNRRTLLSEGVDDRSIFVTGNPVVDSLQRMIRSARPAGHVRAVLDRFRDLKLIVLTTHRRESMGGAMMQNLRVLRDFVDRNEDTALIFPVHLNPRVKDAAETELREHERICLLPPVGYAEFLALLNEAWLIVSDSGGVQEEAPSLGKPLLILRENTERPEAIEAGVARLVGSGAENLRQLLEEAYAGPNWTDGVGRIPNPFGQGDAGVRILDAVEQMLELNVSEPQPVREVAFA